ncbi:hypothetical protein F5877DRAFT_73445, partial [Lentinula edodes]
ERSSGKKRPIDNSQDTMAKKKKVNTVPSLTVLNPLYSGLQSSTKNTSQGSLLNGSQQKATEDDTTQDDDYDELLGEDDDVCEQSDFSRMNTLSPITTSVPSDFDLMTVDSALQIVGTPAPTTTTSIRTTTSMVQAVPMSTMLPVQPTVQSVGPALAEETLTMDLPALTKTVTPTMKDPETPTIANSASLTPPIPLAPTVPASGPGPSTSRKPKISAAPYKPSKSSKTARGLCAIDYMAKTPNKNASKVQFDAYWGSVRETDIGKMYQTRANAAGNAMKKDDGAIIGTWADGLFTGIHPLYLRNADGGKTNHSQFLSHPSEDIQKLSQEYATLKQALEAVLQWIVEKVLRIHPDMFQEILATADLLPLNDTSPASLFTSIVVNINVGTLAHRDKNDGYACICVTIGNPKGGELGMYEPKLLIETRNGDVVWH